MGLFLPYNLMIHPFVDTWQEISLTVLLLESVSFLYDQLQCFLHMMVL